MTSPDPSPREPRPQGVQSPWIALLVILGGLLGIGLLFTPARIQNATLSALGAISLGASGLYSFLTAYLSLREKRPILAATIVLLGFILLVLAYDSGLQFSRLIRVR